MATYQRRHNQAGTDCTVGRNSQHCTACQGKMLFLLQPAAGSQAGLGPLGHCLHCTSLTGMHAWGFCCPCKHTDKVLVSALLTARWGAFTIHVHQDIDYHEKKSLGTIMQAEVLYIMQAFRHEALCCNACRIQVVNMR